VQVSAERCGECRQMRFLRQPGRAKPLGGNNPGVNYSFFPAKMPYAAVFLSSVAISCRRCLDTPGYYHREHAERLQMKPHTWKSAAQRMAGAIAAHAAYENWTPWQTRAHAMYMAFRECGRWLQRRRSPRSWRSWCRRAVAGDDAWIPWSTQAIRMPDAVRRPPPWKQWSYTAASCFNHSGKDRVDEE